MTKRVKWKRRDGKVVPMNKLSNSHLLNIITVLIRSKDENVSKLFPKYKHLLQEAKRRKLLGVI